MATTRQKIEDKIDKKNKLIQELEAQIATARTEISTLTEVLRMLPKDGTQQIKSSIRPNSLAGKAQKVLAKHGKAMHVTDILNGMKKAPNKKNRDGLASVLSQYYRKGEVFSRPAGNTFGLLAWGDKEPAEPESEPDPFYDIFNTPSQRVVHG